MGLVAAAYFISGLRNPVGAFPAEHRDPVGSELKFVIHRMKQYKITPLISDMTWDAQIIFGRPLQSGLQRLLKVADFKEGLGWGGKRRGTSRTWPIPSPSISTTTTATNGSLKWMKAAWDEWKGNKGCTATEGNAQLFPSPREQVPAHLSAKLP